MSGCRTGRSRTGILLFQGVVCLLAASARGESDLRPVLAPDLRQLRGGAAKGSDDAGKDGGSTSPPSAASLRELRKLLLTLEERVASLAERRGGADGDGTAAGLAAPPSAPAEPSAGMGAPAVLADPCVGDRVRVKPSVSRPRYEWGGVPRDAVGTLSALSAETPDCLVDFPSYPGWRACLSELERVTAAADVPRPGDTVRLRPDVTEPAFPWPTAGELRLRMLRQALAREEQAARKEKSGPPKMERAGAAAPEKGAAAGAAVRVSGTAEARGLAALLTRVEAVRAAGGLGALAVPGRVVE
eukprot:scaffold34137_cov112-Isochrysis_galbana.AAC.1